MRLHARVFGAALFLANAVIAPLLYFDTQPHMIDWWNVGLGALGLALFGLSFARRVRHG